MPTLEKEEILPIVLVASTRDDDDDKDDDDNPLGDGYEDDMTDGEGDSPDGNPDPPKNIVL